MKSSLQLVCPDCRNPLVEASSTELYCTEDNQSFLCKEGIWRMLGKQRTAKLADFISDYEKIRAAEQRGSSDPEYYRALPFMDISGRHAADWAIRARSYKALLSSVLDPAETRTGNRLEILDVGSGNGWLANRLAERGHRVTAIDLATNPLDGLGAFIHYQTDFTPVQAEFDCLPYSDHLADAITFDASLHYSTDYAQTLREARRVLKPSGRVVIIDTPIYSDRDSGLRMVVERHELFEAQYGFRSDALPFENFLTYDRIFELGQQMGIEWCWHWPVPSIRQRSRVWRARLRGRREPAQFAILEGTFV